MVPLSPEQPMQLLQPDSQLPDLSKQIHFHARVIEVVPVRNGYQVIYEHPITHSQSHNNVDHIVLAAPFSALTHVKLDRVFENDPDRLHAIRNLHYENATKIILEFSKLFWETQNKITEGGQSFTDLPIRWVYYPPKEQILPSGRGLLLASYTWGEDSLRWGSLKPEDRIRFALRDVAELHDIQKDSDPKKYHDLLVGGMSHSWAEDEFTFGAFAIFDPHQEKELLN
jgi:monoamine oxidase